MTAARELSDDECDAIYRAVLIGGEIPTHRLLCSAAYAAGRESMRKDAVETINRLYMVPHSVILCCDTIDVAGAALDALP